jgi:acetylglutamate kinase
MEAKSERASVLIEALPYIRTLADKVVVIKLGGAALEAADIDAVLQDIVLLRLVGVKPVIVHGGGPEISAMQKQRGIEPEFIDGLRVTDERTIELVKTALAEKIGPDLSARIGRLGSESVSLPGYEGPIIRVTKHAAKNGADLGFVGLIQQVNSGPINAVLERGAIPVIQSLGRGADGNIYNINADDAASEIAIAMHAMKFMLCTNVEGVRGSSGELCSELDTQTTEELIAGGVVKGGMVPKVRAALRAAANGCVVHIIDARLKHSLLLELLTEVGVGTMLRAEQPAGVPS